MYYDSQDQDYSDSDTPSHKHESDDEDHDPGGLFKDSEDSAQVPVKHNSLGHKINKKLDRSQRALCRVLKARDVGEKEIAFMLNRSVTNIRKILKNRFASPDDLANDDKYITDDMKSRYLEISNQSTGQRRRSGESFEHVPVETMRSTRRATEKSESGQPSSSQSVSSSKKIAVKINQRDRTASTSLRRSRSNNKVISSTLGSFLGQIDQGMKVLLPQLQEAGMDDNFFHELRTWTTDAQQEVLDELVRTKVLNRIQSLKFRKAL